MPVVEGNLLVKASCAGSLILPGLLVIKVNGLNGHKAGITCHTKEFVFLRIAAGGGNIVKLNTLTTSYGKGFELIIPDGVYM